MTPPVVQSVLPHLQTLPAGAATAYHERTKHGLSRYARGPETLDWDAQPDPFRRYARAPLEPLPLTADTVDLPWSQLFIPGAIPPRRFNRTSLGLLLELSFALAAWKQQGPDRWAVRCNPSSGNLHPTEAYVLSRGSTALDDALYHYAPREHALEMRCRLTSDLPTDAPDDQPRVYVGLSSIHSREAWKYGERAFRYCQLDVGHAIGALRYAAAVLGWRTRIAPVAGDALAHLLGLDRDADFGDAEREDPELLIELIADPARGSDPARVANPTSWTERAQWRGHANRLDHHPMYHWPVIDEVARATLPGSVSTLDQHAAAPPVHEPLANEFSAHEFAAHEPLAHPALPHAPLSIHVADRLDPGPRSRERAANLIRGRRSAQQFDRRGRIDANAFLRMVAALMPGPTQRAPWDIWPDTPRVHPVFFVHRVDGMVPGAYALPRSSAAQTALRAAMSEALAWTAPAQCPPDLPLRLLAENPALAGTLRTISCHQALASDAVFAVAMLAEFEPGLSADPALYRARFQECGLLGQVLYMEAEAAGLRGTGIGCYFDDASHELLRLSGRRFQVLYHFTVGVPITDTRIATEPPYAARAIDDPAPTAVDPDHLPENRP